MKAYLVAVAAVCSIALQGCNEEMSEIDEALKKEQLVCKEDCANYELGFLCYKGSLSMPINPLLLSCSCTDELKQGYGDVPADCANGDIIARYGFSPVQIKDREIAIQGKWSVGTGDKASTVAFGMLGLVGLAGLAVSSVATVFAAGRLVVRGVTGLLRPTDETPATFTAVPSEEMFIRDGLMEADGDYA
mmetsp:Transcript_26383/g.48217  ORF Transcript_26383/g.48217 Transcript_26383/m.48217 type:complete len:190 (-) Transcript_26383:79-648(-)